jgi:DNA-binding transcriptional regulator YiaG
LCYNKERYKLDNHQIKELRKSLDLTTQALADKIGVTRYTINRWESGESKPQPRSNRELERLKAKVKHD